MKYTLEIENLNKEYFSMERNPFRIKDVSFNLKPGYIMGFIGPNGSGKTTIIKLIMNLIEKDSGTIKLFGMDNIEEEKKVKDRIGFVYDESYFYEDLSMEDMKDIIAPFYTKWNEDRFNKYMEDFDLNKKQQIASLSKGMKTKYALAIALSHEADFIIMDEPTAGLDPIFRREILEVLQETIEDENKSIFFSTHITTDLDKIADYITFINDGEIVLSESKEKIIEDYKLVKGGLDDINSETEEKFIGINKTSIGFEGLIKNEDITYLEENKIIIENPKLEDLMYYMLKNK